MVVDCILEINLPYLNLLNIPEDGFRQAVLLNNASFHPVIQDSSKTDRLRFPGVSTLSTMAPKSKKGTTMSLADFLQNENGKCWVIFQVNESWAEEPFQLPTARKNKTILKGP